MNSNVEIARVLNSKSGQMVVELALVMPILILLIIMSANLIYFLELSTRFHRVAQDTVLIVAASPSSGESVSALTIEDEIENAMNLPKNCKISVVIKDAHTKAESLLSLSAHTKKYYCKITYSPWPRLLVIGNRVASSFDITHSVAIVIDPF